MGSSIFTKRIYFSEKKAKKLFYINLSLFLLAWFAVGIYTLLSIINTEIYYSFSIFLLFLLLLDILVFPLAWFYWQSKRPTIQHKMLVQMMAVIPAYFWGFATIYNLITIRLDALQLRILSFAYSWEVIFIGAITTFFILRITKQADDFLKNDASKLSNDEIIQIHSNISRLPFKISVLLTLSVFVGYVMGAFQLYVFAFLPLVEVIKDIFSGAILGILASFTVLFMTNRILEPALSKSGKIIEALPQEYERKKISLFLKIYAVTGLLALVSVGFYGPMAYNRGQALLESELKTHMHQSLEISNLRHKSEGQFANYDDYHNYFGDNGRLFLLSRKSTDTNYSVLNSKPRNALLPDVLNSIQPSSRETIFINRKYDVKIVGLAPVGNDLFIAGIIYLTDFDDELINLVLFNIYGLIIIIISIVIASTLFASSITKPVISIREGAIKIGQGNFNDKILVFTNDELEEAGSAMNKAASQLKDSRDHLEDIIKKRTRELAEANKKKKIHIDELQQTTKILKSRESQLQIANEKLQEMDLAKSQFVSIAAHQLRTPLAAIKWIFHMMTEGDFGKLQKRQLQVLDKGSESVNRLIKLVGDLLNVARIEKGGFIYRFENISIRNLINNIISDLGHKIENANLSVKLDMQDKSFPKQRGDSEYLTIALQNIIENSVDYTAPGKEIKITIVTLDNKNYQIIVEDEGYGIPARQQKLLFHKFFRGNNIMKKNIPGTGLGLFIAHKIIEGHKGTIDVISEEGKGTKFIVTLPFMM